MLLELHVAGLGVIDDSTLRFEAGLTALTGETGAGKTILVDALTLVMGGRPKRGLVQVGRTALIEALFLDEDNNEVILARELPSEGRARAWIDGRMTPVSALAERAVGLCDIHGQHAHQSLLKAGAFKSALDSFGAIDTAALVAARRTISELAREERSLGGSPEDIDRERALLEYQLNETQEANIEDPDEIEKLLSTVKLLEGGESVRSTLEEGLEALGGDSTDSPQGVLGRLRKELGAYDSFEGLTESLISTEAMLTELLRDLRQASEDVDQDPERLIQANERLMVLHHLVRRYGPTLMDVLERQKEYQIQLEVLIDAESSRKSLSARLEAARVRLEQVSKEVEQKRRKKAPIMEKELLERLGSLALERARLSIEISGPAGDDVDLLFSANPGLGLAPVASVASGGELARLMLAIRLALPGGPPTMVFDEVDAGIGGTTAMALAAALSDVARDRQVLVVTHLAQVAAVATHHISVVKDPDGDSTLATALVLTPDDRIREIARMLSGQPDNETALRHAQELLAH